MLPLLRKLTLGVPAIPTMMHVTHAKAGSTWIYSILQHLFPSQVTHRGLLVAAAVGKDLNKYYFKPARVYPAMFMTREEFLTHEELRDIKRFVVIRDLRDAVVSLYFSLKISHPIKGNERMQMDREELQSLSIEDGFLRILDGRAVRLAAIQTSWADSGEIVLRYEDLLKNDLAMFEDLFIHRFKLPVTKGELARALREASFEKVFKRKLGEEDICSHGRKGLPGDWKNYFTPKIRERFLERYGDILIATGYEKDNSWIDT